MDSACGPSVFHPETSADPGRRPSVGPEAHGSGVGSARRIHIVRNARAFRFRRGADSHDHQGDPVKAGVFQFCPAFGEVRSNLERITTALSGSGADLMVLPELCLSGYQFTSLDEVRALSEPVPDGPTVQALSDLARSRKMFIVAGLSEQADGKIFNSAVLIGPEGWMGTYRKTHLFFEETLWFSPGDTGFRLWEAEGVRLGLMVCFDWTFPEAARSLALAGADIICHPANLILPYCPDAMVTRSIENRVFTLTANRTGTESRGAKPALRFIGKSQATGVRGEILFRMGEEEEGVRVTEFDPLAARDKRANEYNDLFGDRRAGMYDLE
ncbi:acyltransferase [bacterium]|nr:acyltransferase [bacterium]